ncbi:hypothetical protein BCR44DRAFT_48728 [Catenaria anguillulae PL171]|uniref:Uncharacterized protein n=1 Tax=Catenaria anguillulae PL171 TaxID=765915 RepID=A0A1Y2HPG4_9FUNG|nr:hypothetical protein BCR44DRAFT_48728 [Catenaria anguillulae PL171]
MTALRTVDFGNLVRNVDKGADVDTAICVGSSHVSRLDAELIHYQSSGWSVIRGLQVYCSGGGQPTRLNFGKQVALPPYSISQVAGLEAPNGIRDLIVHSKDWINKLGYAGKSAGGDDGVRWEQSTTGLASCLLKGIDLYYNQWADGARLYFDCSVPAPSPTLLEVVTGTRPPSPPSPSPSPASTIPPAPPVSTSVLLPSPTPVTTTIVVGSGANATTIVTTVMVTPTPTTVTFPANAAAAASAPIVITTGPASTTVINNNLPMQPVQPAQQVERVSPFLVGSLAGLALVLLATVLTLFLISRRRRHAEARGESIELSSCRAVPSPPVEESFPPGVDPPSYLTVPIPRPASNEIELEVPPIANANLKGKKGEGQE